MLNLNNFIMDFSKTYQIFQKRIYQRRKGNYVVHAKNIQE